MRVIISGGEINNVRAGDGIGSGKTNSDGLSKKIDDVNGHKGQLDFVEAEEGVILMRRSVSTDSLFRVWNRNFLMRR